MEHGIANEQPTCKRCGVVGAEAFARRTVRGKLRFQTYCKACQVAYHREWRATASGRQKMRQGVRKSRARYPEKEAAR